MMECIGCRESWLGGLAASSGLSFSSCSSHSSCKELDGRIVFSSRRRMGDGGCRSLWQFSSSSVVAMDGRRDRRRPAASRYDAGKGRDERDDEYGGDVRERVERVERVEWPRHVDRISSVINPFVRQCLRLRQSRSYRNETGLALVVGRVPLSRCSKNNSSMQSSHCARTSEATLPSKLRQHIQVDDRLGHRWISTFTMDKRTNNNSQLRRQTRTNATRAQESPQEGNAARVRQRKSGNVAAERITTEEEVYSFDGGWAKGFNVPELGDHMDTMIDGQEPRMSRKEKQQREKALRIAAQKPSTQKTSVPEPERTTHKLLRVMAGKEGGRKLWSPADEKVRPMMEVVRGAVFSMLQALSGSPSAMPPGRWLDLYSGTGSVGIEALSRGCESSHFVELDPWVINNVLWRNLDATNFTEKAVIHMQKVEAFLERAEKSEAQFAGGVFDYVSVTPPYEAVVYSELMSQIARSPLIGKSTCIVVEYPLKSKGDILDRCGPLHKIRDRRYGRTNVAVYGPEWALE